MTPLLLIPAFALLNRAAGWNPAESWSRRHNGAPESAAPDWMRVAKYVTDKFACAGYAGLLVACWDWKLGIVTALGFAFWRLFGWGAMFHSFNGRPYRATGFLSGIVGRLVGERSKLAAIVYGGVRGFLGVLPWAIGFGYFSLISGAAILATGLAMGGVYWLGGTHQRATGRDTGIMFSELLYGALLGAVTAWGIG